MRWREYGLPAAAGAATTAGLIAAVLAPPDRVQGELVRLMYVHVPAAWVAYVGFALTCGASAVWLWRQDPVADRLAGAAAELGVVCTGLTLLLGSIWGKPVWGVWWTWDPRLVSTAVMFFVYLAYLALRRSDPDVISRARRSAMFGVVAFAQIPVVHLSVLWWRSLHQPPTVLRPGDPTLDHRMLGALLLNLLAATLLFALALRARLRLAAVEDRIEAEQRRDDRPLAGAAVVAPRGPGDTGV